MLQFDRFFVIRSTYYGCHGGTEIQNEHHTVSSCQEGNMGAWKNLIACWGWFITVMR